MLDHRVPMREYRLTVQVGSSLQQRGNRRHFAASAASTVPTAPVSLAVGGWDAQKWVSILIDIPYKA